MIRIELSQLASNRARKQRLFNRDSQFFVIGPKVKIDLIDLDPSRLQALNGSKAVLPHVLFEGRPSLTSRLTAGLLPMRQLDVA